ncbi:MAG: hypothetical protein A2096_04805 [Spirochaetes bacterium GWF1_41_5]|nr:MAG: hypothetical protein A2096_04805 [Spirochaetes bacterium GWF1_41_5]HBE04504.1 hypothetical protein [Spirochaetia bacterium]
MRVIESFSKGLKILEYIVQSGDIKISDAAEHFDMPSSNMTLFFNSLYTEGYILKNPRKAYSASQKLSLLAEKIKNKNAAIMEACREPMNELFAAYGEMTLLGILEQKRVIFIERIQSDKNIRIADDYTTSYIPHVTAAGKAIISAYPETMIREYVETADLRRFTDKTLITKKAVLEELMRAKENGYALNRGEYEADIMAVSTAVLDNGIPCASLTVQFPAYRFSENDLVHYAKSLIASAKSASSHLQKNSKPRSAS